MSITPSNLSSWSAHGSDFTFGGYAEQPKGLEGASFAPRAIARIIDYVVHYGVGFLAGRVFLFMLRTASGGHIPFRILFRLSHRSAALFCASLAGAIAYQIICEAVHGSSLGKLFLSLTVLQDDGSPCQLRSAIIRELGFIVDSIFFGVVGYMAMKRTPQQKRYGDEWADTIVCETHQLEPGNRRSAGRFVIGLTFGLMADAALVLLGLLVQINN